MNNDVQKLLEYHGLAAPATGPDPFLLQSDRRILRLKPAPIVALTAHTRVEHREDGTVGVCRHDITWWRARTWS